MTERNFVPKEESRQDYFYYGKHVKGSLVEEGKSFEKWLQTGFMTILIPTKLDNNTRHNTLTNIAIIFLHNNFIKNGPATLQLLIPQAATQQSYLVLPSRPSQSYNAYESLYHLGKKEYFNTNNILRDQYSQRINLYSPNYSNPYQREEQLPPKAKEP